MESVSENALSGKGLVALLKAVSVHPGLKTFEAEGMKRGKGIAQHIVAILAKNHVLESVSFSKNRIQDEGCAAIIAALKGNSSIQTLKLDQCAAGDATCAALADVLASSKTLKSVGISSQFITKAGGDKVAAALKGNTTLKELRYSMCVGVCMSLPILRFDYLFACKMCNQFFLVYFIFFAHCRVLNCKLTRASLHFDLFHPPPPID